MFQSFRRVLSNGYPETDGEPFAPQTKLARWPAPAERQQLAETTAP
jgi:hypothetical protein